MTVTTSNNHRPFTLPIWFLLYFFLFSSFFLYFYFLFLSISTSSFSLNFFLFVLLSFFDGQKTRKWYDRKQGSTKMYRDKEIKRKKKERERKEGSLPGLLHNFHWFICPFIFFRSLSVPLSLSFSCLLSLSLWYFLSEKYISIPIYSLAWFSSLFQGERERMKGRKNVSCFAVFVIGSKSCCKETFF